MTLKSTAVDFNVTGEIVGVKVVCAGSAELVGGVGGGGVAQAKRQKAECGLPKDHSWYAEGEADDNLAGKARHPVAENNPGMARTDQACGDGIILFSQ